MSEAAASAVDAATADVATTGGSGGDATASASGISLGTTKYSVKIPAVITSLTLALLSAWLSTFHCLCSYRDSLCVSVTLSFSLCLCRFLLYLSTLSASALASALTSASARYLSLSYPSQPGLIIVHPLY